LVSKDSEPNPDHPLVKSSLSSQPLSFYFGSYRSVGSSIGTLFDSWVATTQPADQNCCSQMLGSAHQAK